MKKLTIVIAIFILLSLSSCKKQSSFDVSTNEKGELVYISQSNTTTMSKELPAVIKYNENKIALVNVEINERYVYHQYLIHVIATFDTSKLNEDEKYWLDEDFSYDGYIEDKDNNIEFTRMPIFKTEKDGDSIIVTFTTYDSGIEARHSFDGCTISIVASCKQEEQYEYVDEEGETKHLNKTETIHFSYTPNFNSEGTTVNNEATT